MSVRVLGPVHGVTARGSIVELPSTSQRRIVALLALHAPRAVRPDLMHELTGLSPAALRMAVSRIRHLLGDRSIETTASGYRLALPVDADLLLAAIRSSAGDASRLERALDEWHGPAYADLRGDAWFAGDATRLDETHAAAVEDLAEMLLADGRCADVIARLEPHIAEHPLRDRSRGQLMRALAGAGRQAEALRAFQAYRNLLVDELGTEPSPEVRRIEQRIAAGWPGRDVASPEPRAGATRAPDMTPTFTARPGSRSILPSALAATDHIVGRGEVLDELGAVLRTTLASGRLHTVLLTGDAGIGKTTLAGGFVRSQAAAFCRVLYGRCDETEFVPLQPFRSIVVQLAESAPPDVIESHVAHYGGELLRLAPQLAPRLGAARPGPLSSDDATSRAMLFESIADLLVRCARRGPLIVVLDDLHWAEATTLQLVRYLANAAADTPLLLTVCTRDPRETGSDQLRATLAELGRNRCVRIELTNLDPRGLTDLVRSLTGAEGPVDAIVERLHTETAGNPLLASQLVRHWSDGGRSITDDPLDQLPASLRDLVVHRMAALGDGGHQVLTAAAVLGASFDESLLREMVDVDQQTVDVILDAALAAGLLIDEDSATRRMHFAHGLVVKAIHAELRGPRRRRLHERAARAIEKGCDAESPGVLAQLAQHFALAGLADDARTWAALAGDQFLAVHAPAEAVTWYTAALEHAAAGTCTGHERAELLVRLGDAQQRAGDPLALRTLWDGAELARRCGADDALVRAVLATDRGFMRLGDFAPKQLQLVEWALAVTPTGDRRSRAHLLALLGQSLVHTGDRVRRLSAAHEALQLTEGDDQLLARIGPGLLYALWSPDNAELRNTLARRTVAAAALAADPYLEFSAHSVAHNVAVSIGDAHAAERSIQRMRELAEQFATPRMRWMVRAVDTFQLTMAARFEEAESAVNETFRIGSQMDEHDAFTIFASQFFVLGTFAGRHAELLPIVQMAADASAVSLPFRLAHGIVRAAAGERDVAAELLGECLDRGLEAIDPDLFWMTTLVGLAILAIELKDASAARMLLPALVPYAAEVSFNGVTSQGPVAAYVGKLASLLGDHDLADRHLQHALELADSFGWVYHRATTIVAQVESRLRRTGELDEATASMLDAAEALCRAHGIRTWEDKAAALRSRYAGAPARRRPLDDERSR